MKFDFHVFNAMAWKFCLASERRSKESGSERASRFDPAIDKNKIMLVIAVIGLWADNLEADTV